MIYTAWTMSHVQEAIIVGLFAVFITSGWLQQRAVDKWAQKTGRAPMIQKGRGSWGAYMRATEHEMPLALRKRIALLNWTGSFALMLFVLAAAFMGARHHS